MVEVPLEAFAQLVEHHPGPILRLNTEGVIVYANPAAQQLLELTDLHGSRWTEVCATVSNDDWSGLLRSGKPLVIEHETISRCLWLCHQYHPTEHMVYVYGADVTDRTVFERELLRQQQVISDIARFPHMNPAPVLRLERDGTIILCNIAAAEVFGSELQGKNWLKVCPGLSHELWSSIVNSKEITRVHVDFGNACFVFSHRIDVESNLVFVFGSDVTSLELAQRELARQKEELREIARFPDMNPGPVLRMNYDGTVLLCNTASQILFGINLLGTNWRSTLPGLSDLRWTTIIQSSTVQSVEAILNGRAFVFHHRHDPKTELVFVFGTDITLQRLAEQTLRQSERMATLGTLAAGVAHELNNPAAAATRAAQQLELTFTDLQRVRALLEAQHLHADENTLLEQCIEKAKLSSEHEVRHSALQRAEAESDCEDWLAQLKVAEPWKYSASLVRMGYDAVTLSKTFSGIRTEIIPIIIRFVDHVFQMYTLMQEIHEGSSRISEIVGALKNYSFLGQAPVQNVDVHAGLDNTLVILRSKLKEGVEVTRLYAEDCPHITAYGSELNQVWTNIIDNAIDAMRAKGEIRISTRFNEHHVFVEIEDNGPGIPETIQSRIFDPFFTTKEPGKGTGLGLSTSYGIVVEKHKGTISLNSQPGKTVFTVQLPIHADIGDEQGSV